MLGAMGVGEATEKIKKIKKEVRRPLQPVEQRELVLKPMFIALLAIREAERLRYVCFDGSGRYKRASNRLGSAIRALRQHLTRNLTHAEANLMQFLEYRFFKDTEKAITLLRLNCDQYIKSLNPDFAEVGISAQAEVTRFLARTTIEMTDYNVNRIVARSLNVPLMLDVPGIEALVQMQEACVEIEGVSSAPQVCRPSVARQKTLEESIDAAMRSLDRTPVAQADKFACCGVCGYYTYEEGTKGRCKFPLNKASQMREACKRFRRITENHDVKIGKNY